MKKSFVHTYQKIHWNKLLKIICTYGVHNQNFVYTLFLKKKQKQKIKRASLKFLCILKVTYFLNKEELNQSLYIHVCVFQKFHAFINAISQHFRTFIHAFHHQKSKVSCNNQKLKVQKLEVSFSIQKNQNSMQKLKVLCTHFMHAFMHSHQSFNQIRSSRFKLKLKH